MKLLPCRHQFDATEIHRFSENIVAGICWKCDRVYTAAYGLALPGHINRRPQVPCPHCDGLGKVHALTVSASSPQGAE